MANMFRSYLGSGGGIAPTGNAQPADVLADKTFSNSSGINKVGTMTNNGAIDETIDPGETYTIPEGYHNGSGVVNANNPTPTYTTLWTTSDSSISFRSGVLTLSNSISNFDYIEIECNYSTSIASSTKFTFNVNELVTWQYSSSGANLIGAMGLRSTVSYYVRFVEYVDSSSIRISECYKAYEVAASNNSIIPISIKGIKY